VEENGAGIQGNRGVSLIDVTRFTLSPETRARHMATTAHRVQYTILFDTSMWLLIGGLCGQNAISRGEIAVLV